MLIGGRPLAPSSWDALTRRVWVHRPLLTQSPGRVLPREIALVHRHPFTSPSPTVGMSGVHFPETVAVVDNPVGRSTPPPCMVCVTKAVGFVHWGLSGILSLTGRAETAVALNHIAAMTVVVPA